MDHHRFRHLQARGRPGSPELIRLTHIRITTMKTMTCPTHRWLNCPQIGKRHRNNETKTRRQHEDSNSSSENISSAKDVHRRAMGSVSPTNSRGLSRQAAIRRRRVCPTMLGIHSAGGAGQELVFHGGILIASSLSARGLPGSPRCADVGHRGDSILPPWIRGQIESETCSRPWASRVLGHHRSSLEIQAWP